MVTPSAMILNGPGLVNVKFSLSSIRGSDDVSLARKKSRIESSKRFDIITNIVAAFFKPKIKSKL